MTSSTMIIRLATAALLIAATAGAAAAQAAPARLIPFQGRLTAVNGSPVTDGVYKLTFNVYDQVTDGDSCWEEVHPSVSVIGGQVNVILGAIRRLDDPDGDNDASDAINFNPTAGSNCEPTPTTSCACLGRGQRYLGITIGDNPLEMVPRHQLVPSFHARSADIADAVTVGGVTTSMLADEAVTTDKIDNNSITAAKLNSTLEIGAFVNGSIKGADVTSNDDDGLGSLNIKNGTLKGEDLTTQDADGITGANIKDGSIADQDLSVLPSVQVWGNGAVTLSSSGAVIPFQNRDWDDSQMHCELNEDAGDPNCTNRPITRLYAPRAGYYAMAGLVTIGTCGSLIGGNLCIVKNGTGPALWCDEVQYGTESVSHVARLAAGDYVELYVAQFAGCQGTAFPSNPSGGFTDTRAPRFSMTLIR